jgi:hypothetical protein
LPFFASFAELCGLGEKSNLHSSGIPGTLFALTEMGAVLAPSAKRLINGN